MALRGTLLVVGHDSTNPTGGYRGPHDAAVLFSPDDVVADLAGSDLEVGRVERVTRTLSTVDGERSAIDALARGLPAAGAP